MIKTRCSVALALVVVVGGLSNNRDASIIFKLDDILFLKIVEDRVGLVEVLVGLFGELKLGLKILDLLKPLIQGSVLISIDTLLFSVGGLGQPSLRVGLQELSRRSLRATKFKKKG